MVMDRIRRICNQMLMGLNDASFVLEEIERKEFEVVDMVADNERNIALIEVVCNKTKQTYAIRVDRVQPKLKVVK